MKTKITLLFLILSLVSFAGHVFSPKKRADLLFNEFKYSKAIPLYLKATEDKDTLVRKDATVRLADCFRLMNNMDEARLWYEQVVAFRNIPPINYYYLGMSLRTLENYKEAEIAFLKYAELASYDPRGKAYASYCSQIRQWQDLPQCAEIKNAKGLNSSCSDFAPVYYQEGIVFSSDRDVDMIEEQTYLWTSFGYLDMYQSNPVFNNDFWNEMNAPEKMSSIYNQAYHDGPLCFSSDFKKVFITRTLQQKSAWKKNNGNIPTNLLKIFYATLDAKEVEFEAFPFNSDDYSVGHPALSKDGKRIIFSSDMDGGYGESDLYISELVNGEWSKPINLGHEINTFGNEVFPFWANDSTLYFSSDGLPGYGGLDVYESRFENGQWSAPWNLKSPINSSYDDFSIVFNPNGKDGFVCSNRPGGLGSDDIYTFRDYKRTPSITPEIKSEEKPALFVDEPIISGYVKNKSTMEPISNATVFLFNTLKNEVSVLKTDTNGYYEAPIEKGILYVAKAMKSDFFDDCLNFRISQQETALELKTPRDLLLDKYQLNQVFRIDNIYYDLDKWFIREDAQPALDNLVRILKRYPISVELGSHTDSRASFEYNIELSQKRAESAVRYIVMNGIDPIRITAKGYGETQLTNHCKDGVPCSEEEHQANRRTEFKITSIGSTSSSGNAFDPTVFKAGDIIPAQLLGVDFFNACLEEFSSADSMK